MYGPRFPGPPFTAGVAGTGAQVPPPPATLNDVQALRGELVYRSTTLNTVVCVHGDRLKTLEQQVADAQTRLEALEARIAAQDAIIAAYRAGGGVVAGAAGAVAVPQDGAAAIATPHTRAHVADAVDDSCATAAVDDTTTGGPTGNASPRDGDGDVALSARDEGSAPQTAAAEAPAEVAVSTASVATTSPEDTARPAPREDDPSTAANCVEAAPHPPRTDVWASAAKLDPHLHRYLSWTDDDGGARSLNTTAAHAMPPASATLQRSASTWSYLPVACTTIAVQVDESAYEAVPEATDGYDFAVPTGAYASVAHVDSGGLAGAARADDARSSTAGTLTSVAPDVSTAGAAYAAIPAASAHPLLSNYASIPGSLSPQPSDIAAYDSVPAVGARPALPAAAAYAAIDASAAAAGHAPHGAPYTATVSVPSPAALTPTMHTPANLAWSGKWRCAFDLPMHTPMARMHRALALHSVASAFTQAAQVTVITIVDGLSLPAHERTLHPIDAGGVAGGEKYLHDGIFFKFARDWAGLYGGDEFAMKAASLELGNMRAIHHAELHLRLIDAFASARSTTAPLDGDTTLPCVPLATVIDYAGYRVLALAQLPIDRGTLIYGSSDAGKTVEVRDGDIAAVMTRLGRSMNLQPHMVGTGEGAREIALCADIEVHAGHDGRRYIVDTARILPCEAPVPSVTAFLLHANASRTSDATERRARATNITPLDLNRAHSLRELAAVLGADNVGGHHAAQHEALLRRIQVPGATMYLRADANPHVSDAAIRPVSLAEHSEGVRMHGINHVAAAAMDVFGVARGVAGAVQVPVYGDAVLVVGERGQHLYNCLRDVLMLQAPVAVSSDAFSMFGKTDAQRLNADGRTVTQYLLQHVIPQARHALLSEQFLLFSSSSVVRALHERGLNVRHMGMLRVLLASYGDTGDPRYRFTEGSNVRVRRLRSVLMTQLLTRVIKALLRHVLRSVSGGKTTGEESEDVRISALRWCLNAVFAPLGAWSLAAEAGSDAGSGECSENVRTAPEPHDARIDVADSFWRALVRPFLQLKFGCQSPALSPTEMRSDFDLRSGVTRSELLQEVVQQLGLRVRPTWLREVAVTASGAATRYSLFPHLRRGNTALSTSADAAGQTGVHLYGKHFLTHPHDPTLLPWTMRRYFRTEWSAAHHAAFVLPSCQVSAVTAHTAPLRAGADIAPSSKLAAASPWAGFDAASVILEHDSHTAERLGIAVTGLGPTGTGLAPLNDALRLARHTGVDYALTAEAAAEDITLQRAAIAPEDVQHLVAYHASRYNSIEPVIPMDITSMLRSRAAAGAQTGREDRRAQEMVRPGDLLGLDAVATSVFSEHDLLDELDMHPAVAGWATTFSRAWESLTAHWACFDVFACSSDAAIIADVSVLQVDSRLQPSSRPFHAGPASKFGDVLEAVARHPATAAATSVAVGPPCTADISRVDDARCPYVVTNLCIAPLSSDIAAGGDGTVSWDFVLPTGFDIDGWVLGLAHVPILPAGRGETLGWWGVRLPHLTPVGSAQQSSDSARVRAGAGGRPNLQDGREHRVSFSVSVARGSMRVVLDGQLPGVEINGLPTAAQRGPGASSVSVTHPDSAMPIELRAAGMYLGSIGSRARLRVENAAGAACLLVTLSDHRVRAKQAVQVASSLKTPLPLHALLPLCTWAFPLLPAAVLRPLRDACAIAFPVEHSWDLDGGTLRCEALGALLGPRHTVTQAAVLRCARSALLRGDATTCVDTLLQMSQHAGHASVSLPLHLAVQTYVLLGDACASYVRLTAGDWRRTQRVWCAAERWYARAWVALSSVAADPAAQNIVTDLCSASLTPRGTEIPLRHVPVHGCTFTRYVPAPPEWMWRLPPYGQVVLDRLIGALNAQHRMHHAVTLVQTFLFMFLICPAPVHWKWYLPQYHFDRVQVDAPTSPYTRVFGVAIPHAVHGTNDLADVLSARGFHSSADVFDPAFRTGGRSLTAPAADIERWINAVSNCPELPSAYDCEVPCDFGIETAGPDPRYILLTGAADDVDSAIACWQSRNALELLPAIDVTKPGSLILGLHSILTAAHIVREDSELAGNEQVRQAIEDMSARGPAAVPEIMARHRLPETENESVSALALARTPSALYLVSSRGRVLATPVDATSTVDARSLGIADAPDTVAPWGLYPLRSLAGKHIVSITCGDGFTGLLDRAGAVYTFGSNVSGALGTGDTAQRSTPQVVRALQGIRVTHLCAGATHMLAACEIQSPRADDVHVRDETCLYAWGSNARGCCGVGHTRIVLYPTAVRGLRASVRSSPAQPPRVRKLACADSRSAVLLQDGIVLEFGASVHGAPDDGNDVLYPRLVVPVAASSSESTSAVLGLAPRFSTSEQLNMHEASHRTTVASAHIHFIDVSLGRGYLSAVSSEGVLWAMGTLGADPRGVDAKGACSRNALVRTPWFGPHAGAGTHASNTGTVALRVHPIEGALYITCASRDGGSMLPQFHVYAVGSRIALPLGTCVHAHLAYFATPTESAATSIESLPAPIAGLCNATSPLSTLVAQHPTIVALFATSEELKVDAMRALQACAGSAAGDVSPLLEPSCIRFDVAPAHPVSASTLTISYDVPHAVQQNHDSILVQATLSAYGGEPVPVGRALGSFCNLSSPAGSLDMLAPSAPGIYAATLFLGVDASKMTDHGRRDWPAKIAKVFEVTQQPVQLQILTPLIDAHHAVLLMSLMTDRDGLHLLNGGDVVAMFADARCPERITRSQLVTRDACSQYGGVAFPLRSGDDVSARTTTAPVTEVATAADVAARVEKALATAHGEMAPPADVCVSRVGRIGDDAEIDTSMASAAQVVALARSHLAKCPPGLYSMGYYTPDISCLASGRADGALAMVLAGTASRDGNDVYIYDAAVDPGLSLVEHLRGGATVAVKWRLAGHDSLLDSAVIAMIPVELYDRITVTASQRAATMTSTLPSAIAASKPVRDAFNSVMRSVPVAELHALLSHGHGVRLAARGSSASEEAGVAAGTVRIAVPVAAGQHVLVLAAAAPKGSTEPAPSELLVLAASRPIKVDVFAVPGASTGTRTPATPPRSAPSIAPDAGIRGADSAAQSAARSSSEPEDETNGATAAGAPWADADDGAAEGVVDARLSVAERIQLRKAERAAAREERVAAAEAREERVAAADARVAAVRAAAAERAAAMRALRAPRPGPFDSPGAPGQQPHPGRR